MSTAPTREYPFEMYKIKYTIDGNNHQDVSKNLVVGGTYISLYSPTYVPNPRPRYKFLGEYIYCSDYENGNRTCKFENNGVKLDVGINSEILYKVEKTDSIYKAIFIVKDNNVYEIVNKDKGEWSKYITVTPTSYRDNLIQISVSTGKEYTLSEKGYNYIKGIKGKLTGKGGKHNRKTRQVRKNKRNSYKKQSRKSRKH